MQQRKCARIIFSELLIHLHKLRSQLRGPFFILVTPVLKVESACSEVIIICFCLLFVFVFTFDNDKTYNDTRTTLSYNTKTTLEPLHKLTATQWEWNQMKNDPRSYDRNFYNCVKKPENKIRNSTGLEPVTSRYRCDALPTELGSHWRWEQVKFICSRERYVSGLCIWNKYFICIIHSENELAT